MTRIIQSKFKASRRLGVSIWGDSNDPFSAKKNYRPGQHGPLGKVKPSDFGDHLREKQKVKCHYGRVTEKQFRNTFKRAAKMKGNTAENFAGLLERRLDIIVYRLNFAPSVFAARQMVSHCHIRLNGKKINIPSMIVKEGDVISLRDRSKEVMFFAESLQNQVKNVPEYLSFDSADNTGKFIRIPSISDIPYPFEADFNKIVEFYSR